MDALSYSEIWSILNQLENKNMIPNHVLELIDKNRIKEYDANIDLNIPLEKQNLSINSINFLCYLNMEYLCTFQEKEYLKNIYKNNENNSRENLLPVLIGQLKWYEKIWDKIKTLFSLNKKRERINQYEN